MTTLYQIMRNTTYERELIMWLALFFTGLGVLLSATGLFGMISYTVTRRTHEFGVRMALGAQKNDVLRLVMRLGGRCLINFAGRSIRCCWPWLLSGKEWMSPVRP